MVEIEIRFVGRKRAQLVADGRVLRECGRGWAEYYAAIEERRLLEAKGRDRACLCCGRTFRSEGAHNRMCDRCRREA